MQNIGISTSIIATNDKAKKTSKDKDSYLVYVVFEIPDMASKAAQDKEQTILLDCLDVINHTNDIHMHDATANSGEYFTNLNHSERTRIPKILRRLNQSGSEKFYGILSFEAFRNEPVKNKAFNQRVTSINPNILVYDRLNSLFISLIYPHDLSYLGHSVTYDQEGFIQIHLHTHQASSL